MSALNPLQMIEKWKVSNEKVALATVIETWGSSPRPVGSHLAINMKGDFLGSVSGGCVEAEVISQAEQVMKTGKSIILLFDVADHTAWKVGLSCGGRIRILVECIS